MSLQRIAVYANLDKPGAPDALNRLVRWLERHGREVVPPAGLPGIESVKQADLLIVLGGDGTLLAAARLAYPAEVPLLGVNFGRLGFLSSVGFDEMFTALEGVLAGHFRTESRLVLQAEVETGTRTYRGPFHALNDVVVREPGGRSMEIEMVLEGVRLGSFRGDGLIVSTPTGSTAYSLSAGGPILEPSLEAILATAICPHAFAVRPLLFPADQTLEITWRSRGSRVQLAVDGHLVLDLESEQRIRVRRATRPIHFVLIENRSFYEVLRSKLRWGGA